MVEQATIEEAAQTAVVPHEDKPEAETPGTLVRQEFGAIERTVTAETASDAVAAVARARVEARYVMALKRPRDWDDVRARFLKECRRPSFAEVALYSKPRGGKSIEGPSIRMVEVALRCMTNVDVDTPVMFDDVTRRKVAVFVTDLEANVTYTREILLTKTVERRQPESDGSFISVRKNTSGQNVYTVNATEDDLLVKESALVSKTIRTAGKRLFPGDLMEEGESIVRETVRNRTAQDPDAEKRRIVDAFARLNITPNDLKAYLGHEIAQSSPTELEELRRVWTGIKDGDATWKEILEERGRSTGAEQTKTERLKKKVKGGV
jgi:hypothetical protein